MAINLIPEANYLLVAQRRRNIIFVITALIFIVLAITWGGLFWFQYQATQSLRTTEENLKTVETEIRNKRAIVERILLFDRRLGNYENLLNNHISWDPFLGEIERLLPPSTVLKQVFVRAEDGTANIVGTTPVIDALAQTLASLEQREGVNTTAFTSARFENVQREDVKEGPSLYNFTATLEFNPEILNTFR